MIVTKDLRVDYDTLRAVNDLNLNIERGMVFGLIGPNGAGKTTTIRVLATLLEPTYGDVRIGDFDVVENPMEVHRILGYMPDASPTYDDLKVFEFLDVFGMAYGLEGRHRAKRVDECIELTDLVGKRDAFVVTLSRGMKQRLLVAKTLLHDPQVLLMDEPMSGLDPMARIELREVFKQLGAMNKTLLISSHILTELSDFCNSVGIMEKGKMVISGRIDEVSAQLSPHAVLLVDLVAPDERLSAFLTDKPHIKSFGVDGAHARIVFDGTQDDMAELLAAIVNAGLKVRSFAQKKQDLEDIFLKVGAREVA
ncbi:MAG: ABC transporter ATP-binding protein [Planctomycetota bacterium]|nr:ABC transporter ATP-binding protein [Planctomycetota bacterium]